MTEDGGRRTSRRSGPTAVYALVVLFTLTILVALPFALNSVIADITDQSAPIYRLNPPRGLPGGARADAHVQVTALNEWEGTASLRVSMHRYCDPACPWTDRILFISAFGDAEEAGSARPASEVVALAPTVHDVVAMLRLPLYGDPIRYPFDEYELAVGVVVTRVEPGGGTRTLSAREASEYLSLTMQARIPRVRMDPPVELDADAVQNDADREEYMTVRLLRFERPLYLKVLTVVLVLLVTAAAAYAVFMRPLDQLIINSGALVLGVWGVRSILLGTNLNGITAVDLALTTVILFLLVTITVRTAYLLEDQSAVRVFRWRPRAPQGPAAPTADSPPATPDDLVPRGRTPAEPDVLQPGDDASPSGTGGSVAPPA